MSGSNGPESKRKHAGRHPPVRRKDDPTLAPQPLPAVLPKDNTDSDSEGRTFIKTSTRERLDQIRESFNVTDPKLIEIMDRKWIHWNSHKASACAPLDLLDNLYRYTLDMQQLGSSLDTIGKTLKGSNADAATEAHRLVLDTIDRKHRHLRGRAEQWGIRDALETERKRLEEEKNRLSARHSQFADYKDSGGTHGLPETG